MLSKIIMLLTQYGAQFASGFLVTIMLSFITILAGTLFGALICFARMSRFSPIRFCATAYIELIRGTPLMLQLYFFVFLLPRIFPVELTNAQASLLSLILFAGAYIAEIMRAGIQAVDLGQWEAAQSLGLRKKEIMLKIVLPQAVRNILPALGNELINIIKNTSLASIFFIGDLMTVQKTLTGSLYLSLEPMIIVGMIYFCTTFALSKVVARYERRVQTA